MEGHQYSEGDFILLGHRSASLNVGRGGTLSLRDLGFVWILLVVISKNNLGLVYHQSFLSMSLAGL